MMKIKKLPLLLQIVIAIILGIGAGFVFPDWLARIFITFNSIFSSYLGFIVPLLIVAFVSSAIAGLGDKAGKMLLFTAFLAYAFTLMSGFISYGVSSWCFPSMIAPSEYVATEENAAQLAPYFTMNIDPLMSVMTALVLAFVLGLGTAKVHSQPLVKGINGFRDVIAWAIGTSIIPVLPFYIFGIFLNMTMTGQLGPILSAFAKVILVIFCLHVFIMVFEYCIAAVFAKRNPLKCLWTMMPAYFTALGTSSSAATIPVTLKRTIVMGVDKDVAGFTVPLCATIHMTGSTLKIVACALALMIVQGLPYDFGMFASFIAMLGITIIAAPGIPGGSIMASLGLLSSILGFSDVDNALMIALYIAMDSFGTACNVTCDGAIALIVNRFFGKSVKEAA